MTVAGPLFGLQARGTAKTPAPKVLWRHAAPGVEWRRMQWPDGNGGKVSVTVVRAPAKRIHIATGAKLDAAGWRERTRAVAAVNGGYFDTAEQPLGLRISSGVRRRRMHLKRWGVFYVQGGRARIVQSEKYASATRGKRVQEAVQCGPLLVLNRKTQKLKPQSARRTGIGIDGQGRVLVAVADGWLPLSAWAKLWAARSGLHCRDALNLDGGPSSQLSMTTPAADLDIDGGWPVPDAVVVR